MRHMREYLKQHWRGDHSLARSYWVNGVLVNVLLAGLLASGAWSAMQRMPLVVSSALLAFYVLFAALYVWQGVGIWRSASRHALRGGRRAVAFLACLAVILGAVQVAFFATTRALPHASGLAQVIRESLQEPSYRVLVSGTEIELRGFISFGATKAVAAVARERPELGVIRLNSPGGRVLEARELAGLIESRGWSTFSERACMSACTLAFAAGEERWLGMAGTLGFHEPGFPGVTKEQIGPLVEEDKAYLLGRGIERAFVERAYAAEDLWEPPRRQLFDAGFLTRIEPPSHLRVSLEAEIDCDVVARDLEKRPIFAALRGYDEATYRALVEEICASAHLTFGEFHAAIQTRAGETLTSSLPHASDEAIVAFASLLADQLSYLGDLDPDACVAYANDGSAPVAFSRELVERELEVAAGVIVSATASGHAPPPPEEVEPTLTALAQRLEARFGVDLARLGAPTVPAPDSESTCALFQAFYRGVLAHRPEEAARILRHLFRAPG